MQEVRINDCSVFFEELEQVHESGYTHDTRHGRGNGLLNWDRNMLEQAARPLVDVLGSIHDAATAMAPDELELSMQLELAINGETPVFKVLSAGSKCQIKAKLTWK